jgi:membrane-associated protease RseP (regulator of RpoE activity)
MIPDIDIPVWPWRGVLVGWGVKIGETERYRPVAGKEDGMKRVMGTMAAVVIMLMAVPSMAGEGHACTASTQDCLNHMVKSFENRGWVGIEMDDRGGVDRMVITKVIENSPAERAGFRVGDTLVAVNGVAFSEANQKQLKDIQYAMKPGADFTYTVSREGTKVDIDVELGQLPKSVMAQWIGSHMMDHAEVQMASKE